MNKQHKHIIQLSRKELASIQSIIRRGRHNSRVIARARILLLSHNGEGKDAIASRLEIGRSTVQRIRDQYREGSLDRALYDAPRSGQPPKITDEGEAYLIALATSSPPEGEEKWTLELLKEHMVKDGKAPQEITTVAIWKRLDRRKIKPWREKNVVYSCSHTWIYGSHGRSSRPICKTIWSKTTRALFWWKIEAASERYLPRAPCQRGKTSAPRDYEYKRNGTRNIFLAVEPKGGWREATVTRQRTKKDFAEEIKRIIELPRYRHSKRIHVVLDNLNTHFEGSFTETFGTRSAPQILRRIKFHYTPTHGSWLNIAEIELSIFSRQALVGRIPTEEALGKRTSRWKEKRNKQGSTIQWKFTKEDARKVFTYDRVQI
jgi:transposase